MGGCADRRWVVVVLEDLLFDAPPGPLALYWWCWATEFRQSVKALLREVHFHANGPGHGVWPCALW